MRLDGTYQNDYVAGATFGASGFPANYFLRNNPSRTLLNLRGGVTLQNGLDVSVFVQNLLARTSCSMGLAMGAVARRRPGRPRRPPAATTAPTAPSLRRRTSSRAATGCS